MHDMHRRRTKAQRVEFLAGFVGSRASMTPPSASGAFVETQPLIARLLKPPEAAITETTPCAPSLESAALWCCIEKSELNHTQRHTKKVLVQRFSEYIAIMSFAGRSSLSSVWRCIRAKRLRANRVARGFSPPAPTPPTVRPFLVRFRHAPDNDNAHRC